MKYTENYKIKWHDTDAQRRVRPSNILVYMQETANLHLHAYHSNLDTLRDERGLAFLLSRVTVALLAPLHAFDEIDIETWISDGEGSQFLRFFRIWRGEELVAEAMTVWALLDLHSGRLLRNNQFSYPFDGDEAITPRYPVRFRVPKLDQMEKAGERRITFSDIDYNYHMNNTKYPDMLCDFIPSIESRRVLGFSLSYLGEAAFGKTLEVYRSEQDGGFCFRTLDRETGKVCLEACVFTEPIQKEET